MKKLTGLTFTLALLLGACGGGSAGKLEKLKDEACACKDKACAEAVDKKLEAEIEKLSSKGEPDDATKKKIVEVMLEAGECLAKHM